MKPKCIVVPLPEVFSGFEMPIDKSIQEDSSLVAFPLLVEAHRRSIYAEVTEMFYRGEVASDFMEFLKGEEEQSNVANK